MLFISIVGWALLCPALTLKCPPPEKYGKAPPSSCTLPTDPQNRTQSRLEQWFTNDIFDDLFPKANLGWGPSDCRPYSYKAFIFAARYFPNFGSQYVDTDPEGHPLNTDYTPHDTYRRDVAAFFAHTIQETGENAKEIYDVLPKAQAADCFYRGGLYNWFEGGPQSSLVRNHGVDPTDGKYCTASGEYCDSGCNSSWFYPCNNCREGDWCEGCYFGRGALQLSYNCNYGLFERWLHSQKITHEGKRIDLLNNPNLLVTKTDPPLAIMASLWFYMTPQSPKPAMHDIVIGNWVSPDKDYAGGVFGPTSLVINDECNGEDPSDPGGPGESRRIKAFRWFTGYFQVPFNSGASKTVSCKKFNNASRNFNFPDGRFVANSWDVDWDTSWLSSTPCECLMYSYQTYVFAFDPKLMPQYGAMNEANKLWCERLYQRGYRAQPCSLFNGTTIEN